MKEPDHRQDPALRLRHGATGRGRRLAALTATLLAIVATVSPRVLGLPFSDAVPALMSTANELVLQGRFDEARALLESALRATELKERRNAILRGLAYVQSDWGDALMPVEFEENDPKKREKAEAALPHFKEALTLRRMAGDREGEASAWGNLFSAYYDLGDERKATACLAQARVIALDLYKPSFGQRVKRLTVKSVDWLCGVTAMAPLVMFPVVLFLGGISAVAARISNASIVRWTIWGAGLGMAAFVSSTVGMGWLTGELGDLDSVSYHFAARALAVAFGGVVAWTVVRGAAGASRAPRERGHEGRVSLSGMLMGFGAASLAAVVVLNLAAVGVHLSAHSGEVCPLMRDFSEIRHIEKGFS